LHAGPDCHPGRCRNPRPLPRSRIEGRSLSERRQVVERATTRPSPRTEQVLRSGCVPERRQRLGVPSPESASQAPPRIGSRRARPPGRRSRRQRAVRQLRASRGPQSIERATAVSSVPQSVGREGPRRQRGTNLVVRALARLVQEALEVDGLADAGDLRQSPNASPTPARSWDIDAGEAAT
jgi:hypothetical protein